MADLGAGVAAKISLKGQYAAVAHMRWRMFLNSLRTRRGGFEVGARIVMQTFFACIGLGVGLGLGVTSWQIASHSPLRLLAVLLWPLFVIWQFVPIAVASFQENADLSVFLRFPVSFGSYALFYILFGLFDVGSLVGGIGLLGIWVGVSIARPGLILWLTVALALFAAFNVFLTRMIFAWIDRWLAQRKTREILAVVFLFLILGFQFLNPAFNHLRGQAQAINRADALRTFHAVDRVQSVLPPGLAADAISDARAGKPFATFESLASLALFAAAAAALLGVRLRREYRGESLGEAPSRAAKVRRNQKSWLQGSGPIAAVIEKEIRYLSRSGVMLYGFLAPLIIVFLFSGGSHAARGPANFAGQYALPLGVAYSFLGLTRFVYNNLGGEGAGIQLYFLSSTPFRKAMLAKNIVHTAIFLIELLLVCLIVNFRAGLPGPQIFLATFCWLLFAVPAQLAFGNILSITMAYRMNMTRMSRDQGAAGNNLLGLLIELLVFVVGVAVYLPLKIAGHADLAAPILLVLACLSIAFWLGTLSNSGKLAEERKESLIAAIYKTA